ncbi:MAG: ATP-binding protein [Bacteroidota bacterium]
MRTSIKYLLLGAGFGILFPILSTGIALIYRELPVDGAHILQVQVTEPLLWVIDTAPIFLGLLAWFAGKLHQRLEESNASTSTDLEHLFRISQDILCICTAKGEILRGNLALARRLNRPETELAGQALSELMHPDDRATMRSTIAAVGSATQDTLCEAKLITEDGTVQQIDWHLSVPVDQKFLAIGRDVTAQRADQTQLRRYAASLERSLKELDQFAYVVSHDLKAPLRGIHSLADFIEEDLAQEEPQMVHNHLNLLRTRAKRMQNLILGVLTYAQADKQLERRESIILGEFLIDLITEMELPEGVSVLFGLELPTVHFNRARLSQVLGHLIANASQHNDKSEGRVEIAGREADQHWEVSVTDNGPGIPERFHEQVFTMFRTLHPQAEAAGTGIGLPIVKKIVESAGGQVWIDREYESGTRVVFTMVRGQMQ